MKQIFMLVSLMLIPASQAYAWWNTPYAYPPYYNGYWPNSWPPGGYVRPFYYNGSDWRVRGTMSDRGDAHFVIEYHGNMYDDMFGTGYGQRGYPRYPNYGNSWRW